MSNVYYDPEKFGLRVVAELERGGGYEFDTLMVWQRQDGALVWAQDAGCSCPLPFDGIGLNDLHPLRSIHDFEGNATHDDLGELQAFLRRVEAALPGGTRCAACGASPGQPCTNTAGARLGHHHRERREAAR